MDDLRSQMQADDRFDFEPAEAPRLYGEVQEPSRPVVPAMRLGWRGRCPHCGRGSIFSKYLKVRSTCITCGERLDHHRADDAPAYFTIAIVGHVVVPLLLVVEQNWSPAMWVHWILWIPMAALMTLWLLPKVKGTLIGLQWAMRMHGFGGDVDEAGSGPGT